MYRVLEYILESKDVTVDEVSGQFRCECGGLIDIDWFEQTVNCPNCDKF